MARRLSSIRDFIENTDEIPEGENNLYFVDERAQDAVGNILDDGTDGNISFTYDDENNLIYANTQDNEIDHDELTNFVSNEHINHTNITFSTNSPLSGGGTLAANRTFSINLFSNDLGTNSDNELYVKDSGINHDALSNFVSNEHINHSDVSISAGDGLSGGGDLTSSRTIDVRLEIDDSGSNVTSAYGIDFGSNLNVTDDGDNTITVDVPDDLTVMSNYDTDDLSEGNDNLYFTTGRIDDHLSGGTGIDYSSGTISIDSTVTQNTDTDVSENDWVLDEDDLASNSNTKIPTQQSVKSYVDAVEQGLDLKDSVRAATDGSNIDLTSSSDPNPIDGVTLSDGDRVLLKDQSDSIENGIYDTVTATDPTSWVRSSDADDDEVNPGMFTFVEEGDTNNNKGFVLTTNGPITVGSDELNFTQFSGAGQIDAGDGLTKSGDTLNVRLDIDDSDSDVTDAYGINFGSNLDVTDDGDNKVTVDVPDDLTIISNYDTDDLSEGSSNQYFTTSRVDDHLSGGTGISYDSGTIDNTDTGSDAVSSHESDYDHDDFLTDIISESIKDLSDFQDTSYSDGQIPKWNDSESRFEPADDEDTTYSSSDFDHDNLTNTHNLTSDLSPEWDNVTGKPSDLTDMSNYDTDDLSEGSDNKYFFDHDNSNHTTNYLADITNESIRDLSDVQDTDPSDGNALVWNDTESRYEPETIAGENYYLTDVSGDGNSEVTFTVSGTDDVTKDFSHSHSSSDLPSDVVYDSRTITTGTGLSGGGDLSSDRTIDLDANVDKLNDVSSSSESNRDVLVYNDTNSEYENRSLTEADISDLSHYTDSDVDDHLSGGTGINYDTGSISLSAALDDISDVDVSSPTDGYVLTYNSSTSNWEAQEGGSGEENIDPTLIKYSLESDDDFTISNRYQYIVKDLELNDGNITVEDGGELVVLGGDEDTLNGLSDTDISSLTDGQLLKYNSSSDNWENVDIDTRDLSDVQDTAPSDGQALVWNDSESRYEPSSLSKSTRDLSDVQDTSPSDGDALVWNDSESRYEPETISGENYYLTDVSGDGNSEVTFTVSGTDDVTKDFSHSHSSYVEKSGDTMEGNLKMDNNELHFGSAFKMYYNSDTDSLDIEAI